MPASLYAGGTPALLSTLNRPLKPLRPLRPLREKSSDAVLRRSRAKGAKNAKFRAEDTPPWKVQICPVKHSQCNLERRRNPGSLEVGDSITHQCLYTQYVEDFFYTRYPKLHIHFHNAGVGGDRAKDALTRFDEDVAVYKPKYVTILLGMNDGGYTNYQQPIFDTYTKGMTTLLDQIAALGATAVPITPTMFDARAPLRKRRFALHKWRRCAPANIPACEVQLRSFGASFQVQLGNESPAVPI